MATARKKSRAAGQLASPAHSVRVPESMEFLIFEDNGGAYHWRLVASDGATLAQSGSFASYDSAEQAAQRVREGAASARFDRRADEVAPVDLAARRDRPSDELDAERWLDEGGSFSSEPHEQHGPSSRLGPGPSYTCPGCGHVLRLSGLGRHRLYFDRLNTHVTNRVCPVCGHGLPGKSPAWARL